MAKSKTISTINSSDLGMAFTFFNEIGIISQLSNTRFCKNFPQGLTLPQFSILNWFSRVDSTASPGRLTRAMQVSKGSMTYTLKQLESQGLVSISPDKLSGRQKIVKMTTKGKRMRERAISAVQPSLLEILEDLDPQTLQNVLPALQSIREYLDNNR